MKTLRISIIVLALAAVLLAACAPATTPSPTPAPSPTSAPVQSEPTATAAAAQPEGCLGSAEAALVDLNCRKITIAVENAYPPFNYIATDTGQPGGWDYDVWREICTLLHCTPVFVEAAWDGLIQAVSLGQYDVAADGITITADRKQVVDFSEGYLQIQQRLLVRKGENRFDSLESFVANDSLILGTQIATTNYETAAKYLPETRIKGFEQFPFAVQALLSGDVDAVIMDEVIGLGYVGENADQLELIGPPISSDELGFAFPKGSDLVAPVNQAIAALKASGKLDEYNLKYFGPDFKQP